MTIFDLLKPGIDFLTGEDNDIEGAINLYLRSARCNECPVRRDCKELYEKKSPKGHHVPPDDIISEILDEACEQALREYLNTRLE